MSHPPGFTWRRRGADRLLVRAELDDSFERLLSGFLDGRLPAGHRALRGGRGGAVAVDVEGGVTAVLRRNRRGGLPARFLDDVYVGTGRRAFRELSVTEELRRLNVPVPVPLGAIVRRSGPFWYRAAVATQEVAGSRNLWEYLQAVESPEERRGICLAVAGVIERLHEVGAAHPDLNLANFLIAGAAVSPRVWVIDCDRVRLRRPVSACVQRRAWRRVRRSARRLDPAGRVVRPEWFAPGIRKVPRSGD